MIRFAEGTTALTTCQAAYSGQRPVKSYAVSYLLGDDLDLDTDTRQY